MSTYPGISKQVEAIQGTFYLCLRLYGQINRKRLCTVTELHLGQIKLTKYALHISGRFPSLSSCKKKKELWFSPLHRCIEIDVMSWIYFTPCFWLNISVVFLYLHPLTRNMRGRGRRQQSLRRFGRPGFILNHSVQWIEICLFLQHFEILGLKMLL